MTALAVLLAAGVVAPRIERALERLIMRWAFCHRKDEHKREAIVSGFGALHYRCIDCGNIRFLGLVIRSSNRRARWRA